MDINTKILKKNAFRVTKERGMTASRIRGSRWSSGCQISEPNSAYCRNFRKWHSSYYQPTGI